MALANRFTAPSTTAMIYGAAWLQAWFLLTAIPLPKACHKFTFDERSQTQSILFYPLVGAVLATLLSTTFYLLPDNWPLHLSAAVVLVLWVGFTGALHLDGLADSVDALMAGHRDKNRIFKVFKDPSCGAMAVTALICLLLLKTSLLWSLMATQDLVAGLFAAMVFSRLSVFLMVFSCEYVGRGLPSKNPYGAFGPAHLFCAIGSATLIWLCGLALSEILILLVAVTALVVYWRWLWIKRIKGYVGDVLGAQIELVECWVLFLVFTITANG